MTVHASQIEHVETKEDAIIYLRTVLAESYSRVAEDVTLTIGRHDSLLNLSDPQFVSNAYNTLKRIFCSNVDSVYRTISNLEDNEASLTNSELTIICQMQHEGFEEAKELLCEMLSSMIERAKSVEAQAKSLTNDAETLLQTLRNS